MDPVAFTCEMKRALLFIFTHELARGSEQQFYSLYYTKL